MGLMKSKYSQATANEITIDFRGDDHKSSQHESSASSPFGLSNLRPQFPKKHSKTRLQLLKERGRTMISNKNKDEHGQPPSGFLQKMRRTMGNMMPQFRSRQYQMAREEDSAHGGVII
jgi:hypothetical protein